MGLGTHLVHIHMQRQNTCTYQLKFNNWFEGGENKMPIMVDPQSIRREKEKQPHKSLSKR